MYKYSSEHSILNENASVDLTYSLADIYDSISLYEYEEEKIQNEKKAISWEEWYLNKKLLLLKAQKNKLKQKNETLSNEIKLFKVSVCVLFRFFFISLFATNSSASV